MSLICYVIQVKQCVKNSLFGCHGNKLSREIQKQDGIIKGRPNRNNQEIWQTRISAWKEKNQQIEITDRISSLTASKYNVTIY